MTVDDFEGVSGTFRAVDGTGLPINPYLSFISFSTATSISDGIFKNVKGSLADFPAVFL